MSPSCPQYVKGLNGTEQTVKTKAYEWEKKIIKKTAGFERERERKREIKKTAGFEREGKREDEYGL